MPKRIDCSYEGPYSTLSDQKVTFFLKDGAVERTMKSMNCQAPGEGPTKDPISFREAMQDMPYEFFKPKEKPQPQKGVSGSQSKLFGAKKYSKIKFKGKETQGINTYEAYTAKTKNEAIDFLKTKTLTKKLCYIVIETPQGNWGLDINGIYQEK